MPPAPAARRARIALAIIVGIAGLAYLAIAFLLHPVGDYYTESDFYGGYAAGAHLIQQGRIDPARYPVVGPGYDAVLAVVGFATRDPFTAARLISVAAAMAVLALWGLVLARRASPVAAAWTVALVAVNPVFVRYAYSATTDMLATAWISGCAFALIAARWRGAPAVAGALAALACLTRYNAVALLPAGALGLAGGWFGARGGRRRASGTAMFLIAFALVALPWLAWSLSAGHVPGASLFRNFGFYAGAGGTRNVQDAIVDPAAPPDSVDLGEAVRRDPAGLARWVVTGVPRHLARDAVELLGVPVLPLVAAGLLFGLRGGMARALLPVAWIGAWIFASLLPVFYSDRYSMPLAPIYLSLAGVAVSSPMARAGRVGRALQWTVAAALLAWSATESVGVQRRVLARAPVETRAAGHALARIAGPGDRVLSRKGHVGYYAGLETVAFPRFRSLAELAEHARRRDARFLYYSWYEGLLRPELAYLLDTTSAVPGLTPVFATREPPSVLYRIDPAFGHEPAWAGDEFQRSVRNARVMVRLLPDSVAWRHRTVLAVDALAAGRLDAALEMARVATRAQPVDTLGWVVQGEALRMLGRNREALEPYTRALELDAGDRAAAEGLGHAQLALGDVRGAAAAWRPLIGRIDDPASARRMIDVFATTGDTAAVRILRAAAGVRPG